MTTRVFSEGRASQARRVVRSLRVLLGLLWRSERRLSISLLVLQSLQVFTPLAQLWVAKVVIDRLVVALQSPNPLDATQGILTLTGLALVITLIGMAVGEVGEVQRQVLADRLAGHVSVQVLEHAQRLDLETLERAEHQEHLRRLEEGIFYRPAALLFRLVSAFNGAVTLLVAAAILIHLLPLAFPILILAAVPYAAVQSTAAAELFTLSTGQTGETRQARYLAHLLGADSSAKELRSFGLRDHLLGRYRSVLGAQRSRLEGHAWRRAAMGAATAILPATAYAAIFGFLALRALSRSLTVGDLTLYIGLVLRSQDALRQLMLDLSGVVENSLFVEDYQAFLAIQPVLHTRGRAAPPTPIRRGVCLDEVSYRYAGHAQDTLRDVSLELRPGETVALVGENGAGKTTLVKLLLRLYDPQAGAITVDGHDIRDLDPDDWQQQIAVIFQDFVRYSFSAAENIGFGRLESLSDRRSIEAAAWRAGAHHTIAGLPKGFDTPLGRHFEGGMELSGGEWQRIALARAFLRDAPILVLDEPTSALDARSEFEVFRRLSELTRNRIVLLISHRFSTVRLADRIYVLDDGRITEAGTHDELLRRDGRYAELFRLQAAGYR